MLRTQGARVLEGLAASGLRSIRYALELDGVSRIDANDLDPTVVESMRRNIHMNGPDVEAKVQPHCSDARLLMLQNPYVSVFGLMRWCWSLRCNVQALSCPCSPVRSCSA
jgi:tRNA G26 N,N-dimethylase Trm1